MCKNRVDLKRSVAHRSAKIIVVPNFVTKNDITSTLSFDDQPVVVVTVVRRHNIDIVTEPCDDRRSDAMELGALRMSLQTTIS